MSLVLIAVFIDYDTVLIHYDTVLIHYDTVLIHYDTVLIHYDTVLIHYDTMLIHYDTVLIHYDTVLCNFSVSVYENVSTFPWPLSVNLSYSDRDSTYNALSAYFIATVNGQKNGMLCSGGIVLESVGLLSL